MVELLQKKFLVMQHLICMQQNCWPFHYLIRRYVLKMHKLHSLNRKPPCISQENYIYCPIKSYIYGFESMLYNHYKVCFNYKFYWDEKKSGLQMLCKLLWSFWKVFLITYLSSHNICFWNPEFTHNNIKLARKLSLLISSK